MYQNYISLRNYKSIKDENDSLRMYIGEIYKNPELICDSLLNRDNLLTYIRLKGIIWPNVVWAQSMVETGYLSCDNCCLKNNNLFGFMLKGKCMKFPTWQESVNYYFRWQRKLIKPGEDYYKFLTRIHYAHFPDYNIHIAQILIDNKMKYESTW